MRERWDVTPEPHGFPAGAGLVGDGRAWALVADQPERRLGGVLAWARRARVDEVHVLVDDGEAASVLARRAQLFRVPPQVWRIDGRALVAVEPAPIPTFVAPHPTAELEATLLADGGLEVVVEGGQIIGEVLGLEVARVVVDADPGTGADRPRIETGVGRFDREQFALMHPDLTGAEAVRRVAETVRRYRRPGAPPHPLNQLVPERWLRAGLVVRPAPAGVAELRPVESAVPRRNLRQTLPATAVGTDADGGAVVVVCSTGVDLELVPTAADDRLAHAPDARLVLAVPARDVLPVTTELAGALVDPATVVAVEGDWRGWA